MKLAIFDFDGTVIDGNSWHLLFRRMLRERPFRSPALLGALGLRRLRLLAARDLQERTLLLWAGWDRESVAARGRRFYAEVVAPRARTAALAEIARCRREGFEIVLLTGAFDFVVQPFAEAQGVRLWRATRLKYAGEIFSGRLAEPALRGEAKVAALAALLGESPVDWAASRAYGDEEGDLPVLRRVGHPFWVCAARTTPRARPEGCEVVIW